MLKVDIVARNQRGDPKVICTLGWDEEKHKIVILKGQRRGKNILEDRYLDKQTMKHISAADGKKFIERLPYALTGSYVWATKTYQ